MYGLRGLGDTVTYDAAGNPTVVTSAPITTDTVSASGQNVYTNASGQVVAVSAASLIPGVSNTALAIGGATVLFGLLLMGMRR